MRAEIFEFDLPEERIALRPLSPRDSAKLLIVHPQKDILLTEDRIKNLTTYLQKGDGIVVNDTKVIPAQISGIRIRENTSAKIDIILLMQQSEYEWSALLRPLKRIKEGEGISFLQGDILFTAKVLAKKAHGEVLLEFDIGGEALRERLEEIGSIPLPPYIAKKRSVDVADLADYQTLFACNPGAVAAPTAGLHFTPDLIKALQQQGISVHSVTLHVGAGTFLPVKTENIDEHQMHTEFGNISPTTAQELNEIHRRGKKIIAIGTTTLRILESATDEEGNIQPFQGKTNIFITPGYRFKSVDILLTNFHLPRSTLFMLVSAFSGLTNIQQAYKYAIQEKYRFYSYGDACLLFPIKAAERVKKEKREQG